ncbi:MAG TPA: response regulator [bacterium]|nr:response regulator [bacterium]
MKKSLKKKKKPFIKPRSMPVGRAHLLVVDDEADFGKMIQKTLVQAGYRVDAAVSATQAIALQRKHSYDLALVDLRMPEMTGLELLQYLKVRDKKIFVIIMTAYGSFSIGIDALRKGACDYLAKPFQLTVLKDKVREALERRGHYLEEQRIFPERGTIDEL